MRNYCSFNYFMKLKEGERSEKEDGGPDHGQEKRNDKHRVLQTIW